ncbi:MAG TPA: membrane protein insertion efficiency factor YidD [Candidatus Paceibacterota bacterium]|nr:membrane protein insertion efficiency factor YidD [Candidatus Paceibacterota bacterium]
MNSLKKLPNNITILIIKLYRLILSPSVGFLRFLPFYPRPSCVFYPTCSEYSIACFQKYNFFTALRKTTRRVSRCHPFSGGGVDLP